VRFGASPAAPANDERTPVILEDGRVRLCKAARNVRVRHRLASGQAITLNVPLAWYRGVTVDVDIDERAHLNGVRVVLAHADPALEVTVFAAPDDADIVAEWRRWSRDLGLPMMTRLETGDVPVAVRFGALAIGASAPRRIPRAFLKRRPQALRRRTGPVVPARPGRTVRGDAGP
jgi:hypothetical protein